MPELSRPRLFRNIIISEATKHEALSAPVLDMWLAKQAIHVHRGLLKEAEAYVFVTKNKGTEI